MPRDWSELAAVSSLVECKQYQTESRVVTIRVQQLPQVARELRGNWYIAAAIRSVMLEKKFIVIA